MSDSHGSPSRTTATMSGARIMPVSSLVLSIGSAPEPSLAAGEVLESLIEVFHVEVRPELGTEGELGVGRLPQQEVARSLVAPGPNHKVDVRLARGVEMLGEVRLGDLVRVGASGDEGTGGIDDLSATGIVEADVERHPCPLAGALLGGADRTLHVSRRFV